MNVHDFIKTYFKDWTICVELSCGRNHGYLKLGMNMTRIKVYFHLNGEKHWTGKNATVDRVEGCNGMWF